MANKNCNNDDSHDVIIIGGGMAGLTCSLILARSGLSVACVDKTPFDIQESAAFDQRTVAISAGSSAVLQKTGLWNELEPFGCAIRNIDVKDGNSPVLLQFDSGAAGGIFGWIFENRDLRKHLIQAAKKLHNLSLMAPASVSRIHTTDTGVTVDCENGTVLSAPLLIGADGRHSFVRTSLGIDSHAASYRQKALVCVVNHEKPHNGMALEHFYPEGPFALLPMKNDSQGHHRSALVWTRPENDPMHLETISDELFNLALNERCKNMYGIVQIAGKRQSFPLSLVHAKRYIAQRTVLIADAAHAIHPIAGQGLNLGMRDIDTLTDLVIEAHKNKKDIGAHDLIQTYEDRRLPDNHLMIAATDSLNRIFGVRFGPFSLARKLGIRTIQHTPLLKKRLMRYAMGLSLASSK